MDGYNANPVQAEEARKVRFVSSQRLSPYDTYPLSISRG
jgi:hypothetical protein